MPDPFATHVDGGVRGFLELAGIVVVAWIALKGLGMALRAVGIW